MDIKTRTYPRSHRRETSTYLLLALLSLDLPVAAFDLTAALPPPPSSFFGGYLSNESVWAALCRLPAAPLVIDSARTGLIFCCLPLLLPLLFLSKEPPPPFFRWIFVFSGIGGGGGEGESLPFPF